MFFQPRFRSQLTSDQCSLFKRIRLCESKSSCSLFLLVLPPTNLSVRVKNLSFGEYSVLTFSWLDPSSIISSIRS